MNTFYYFEGTIYETLDRVIKATKNYVNKKYDIIETNKDFNSFEDTFDKLRKEGNSVLDSLELAK